MRGGARTLVQRAEGEGRTNSSRAEHGCCAMRIPAVAVSRRLPHCSLRSESLPAASPRLGSIARAIGRAHQKEAGGADAHGCARTEDQACQKTKAWGS